MPEQPLPECFVLMPISDPDGYQKGHFKRVYDDIFAPAIRSAGFAPLRADDVKETNVIHIDILQRLLNAPMALCDLSNRNPNVLFELGLRQAFDKPVVLVQETGTPRIFDIAPLRVVEYRPTRIYNEVLDDQKAIADAIRATQAAGVSKEGVNSLVRLLSLSKPATLPEMSEANRDPALQIIRAEIGELRREIRRGVEAARVAEVTRGAAEALQTRLQSQYRRRQPEKREDEALLQLQQHCAMLDRDLEQLRSIEQEEALRTKFREAFGLLREIFADSKDLQDARAHRVFDEYMELVRRYRDWREAEVRAGRGTIGEIEPFERAVMIGRPSDGVKVE